MTEHSYKDAHILLMGAYKQQRKLKLQQITLSDAFIFYLKITVQFFRIRIS